MAAGRHIEIYWVFVLEVEKQGYENVNCTGLPLKATRPAMLM